MAFILFSLFISLKFNIKYNYMNPLAKRDQLILNGFSTLFQRNVWDLNPSIKWDQLLTIRRLTTLYLLNYKVIFKIIKVIFNYAINSIDKNNRMLKNNTSSE